MRTLPTVLLLCAASLSQAQTYTLSPTFGTNGALHVPFVTGDHYSNVHAITAEGELRWRAVATIAPQFAPGPRASHVHLLFSVR